MIANDLEDRYPDRKSLLGDVSAHSLTLFVASWADGVLQPAIMQFILADIYAHLHEKDKVYFRELRENRVGTTLEKFCANREERVVQFRITVLAPLRLALASKPFLGGGDPTYADYAVFGAFQWARVTSSVQAPRTKRSRCRLARTDARSLWRLGAELCRLSCLSDEKGV